MRLYTLSVRNEKKLIEQHSEAPVKPAESIAQTTCFYTQCVKGMAPDIASQTLYDYYPPCASAIRAASLCAVSKGLNFRVSSLVWGGRGVAACIAAAHH